MLQKNLRLHTKLSTIWFLIKYSFIPKRPVGLLLFTCVPVWGSIEYVKSIVCLQLLVELSEWPWKDSRKNEHPISTNSDTCFNPVTLNLMKWRIYLTILELGAYQSSVGPPILLSKYHYVGAPCEFSFGSCPDKVLYMENASKILMPIFKINEYTLTRQLR